MGGLLLFVLLLVFIFMGVPVAFAIGLSSTIVILMFDIVSPAFFPRAIMMGIESFPLLAIPLFILGGELMNQGGLSGRLVRLAEALVGHFKASLAYVTILSSCFFSAISGSAPATVAAIGSNVLPEMQERGYPTDYAIAIPTVAGATGVLIPPSIPFIMYGLTSEVSVGRLFLAGIIPGILFAIGYAITARVLYSRRKLDLPTIPFNFKNACIAFKDAFFSLLAPVIVLGGIYGGIFSPTEAAAAVCLYAMIVGTIIYRQFTFKTLVESFRKSVVTSATVMCVVAFAIAFARIVNLERVPALVTELLYGVTESQVVILLLINLILIIIGLFMDTTACIIILTPVLAPIAESFGIDLVMFGVIMVANLAIGFCTPPLGYCLFVASGIGKVNIEVVIKAVIPYFISMLIVLLLVMFVPALSLTLPGLAFG